VLKSFASRKTPVLPKPVQIFYDPKPSFLGGIGASSYPREPSARTAFAWHLLRVPVPSPGPASAAPGAAGGDGWAVRRWVAAWEFPRLGWGVEPARGWTDLLPAQGWHGVRAPGISGAAGSTSSALPSFEGPGFTAEPGLFFFHLCCLSQRKPISLFFNRLKVFFGGFSGYFEAHFSQMCFFFSSFFLFFFLVLL